MRRLAPHLLALVLGVVAAVVVGCGGSNDHLIPADQATRLKDRIAEVRAAIDAGDCERAEAAVEQAVASAKLIDSSVDRRLRMRINQGLRKLRERTPIDCHKAETTTETVPTVTETTPTETTPTTTTTTPTTTTPTTTTPTTPTTTTTPPTTPTTTPDSSGGTGAPTP